MTGIDQHRATVDLHGIRPPDAYAIRAETAPGGVVVVVLDGEFDLAAAPLVRDRFAEALAEGASAVVVDMERVTFVDSSALRELLRADATFRAGGGELVLAALPPTVERLLELTRTVDVLTVAPDVAQALTRLAART